MVGAYMIVLLHYTTPHKVSEDLSIIANTIGGLATLLVFCAFIFRIAMQTRMIEERNEEIKELNEKLKSFIPEQGRH